MNIAREWKRHTHREKIIWLNERCTQSAKVAKEIHIRMKWIDVYRPFKNYKPWEKKTNSSASYCRPSKRICARPVNAVACRELTLVFLWFACFYAFSCTSGEIVSSILIRMTRKNNKTNFLILRSTTNRIEANTITPMQRKYINYVTLHMRSNLNSLF